jgi:hypothetical protein
MFVCSTPTCASLSPIWYCLTLPDIHINSTGVLKIAVYSQDQTGFISYMEWGIQTSYFAIFWCVYNMMMKVRVYDHLSPSPWIVDHKFPQFLASEFAFIFYYCFIIHMCIQGLGHFSPLPTRPPLPPTLPPFSPPHLPSTQQKLFCP